jgi:hypothetical protein
MKWVNLPTSLNQSILLSDCQNGFDEISCPDFLKNFDLIGEYKLVNEVSEIWTRIPHSQGVINKKTNKK